MNEKLLKWTKTIESLRRERDSIDVKWVSSKKELDRFRCETTFLRNQSLRELDKIEVEFKTALERISEEKTRRDKAAEQKLCVVCMENQPTVVLMPCKHLCLCGECSQSPTMKKCPMCRKSIENRLEIYSL